MMVLTAGPHCLSFSANEPYTSSAANQGPLHHPGSATLQHLNRTCLSPQSFYLPAFLLLPSAVPTCLFSNVCSGIPVTSLTSLFPPQSYWWSGISLPKDTTTLSQTLSFVQSKNKGASIFCFSNPAVRKLGNEGEVIVSPTNAGHAASLRPLRHFDRPSTHCTWPSHSPQGRSKLCSHFHIMVFHTLLWGAGPFISRMNNYRNGHSVL